MRSARRPAEGCFDPDAGGRSSPPSRLRSAARQGRRVRGAGSAPSLRCRCRLGPEASGGFSFFGSLTSVVVWFFGGFVGVSCCCRREKDQSTRAAMLRPASAPGAPAGCPLSRSSSPGRPAGAPRSRRRSSEAGTCGRRARLRTSRRSPGARMTGLRSPARRGGAWQRARRATQARRAHVRSFCGGGGSRQDSWSFVESAARDASAVCRVFRTALMPG